MLDDPASPQHRANDTGQPAVGDGPGLLQPGGGTEPIPPPGLPAVALPTGGGAIRSIGEEFKTDPSTGTVSLSIPVASSKGRSGFGPALQLSYDSGTGNGPFGLGWQLTLPSITRKTEKGLPSYDDDEDVFILAGAEDLVPALSDDGAGGLSLDALDRVVGGQRYRVLRYRPRVEGLYARIERWTRGDGDVHWRVITRENVTNIYGKDSQARLTDEVSNPPRIFSWLLQESRDAFGNVIQYSYKPEDGLGETADGTPLAELDSEASRFTRGANGGREFLARANRYIKRIRYGNQEPGIAADWHFELVVDYGEHDDQKPTPDETRPWSVRDDRHSTFRPRFELRGYRLARRILLFHSFDELGQTPCLVKSTDIEYSSSPIVTYLTRVTHRHYQRQADGGPYEHADLPSVDIDYVRPQLHDSVTSVDPDALDDIGPPVGYERNRWIDLDGEGIPGLLTTTQGAWFYKPNKGHATFGSSQKLRVVPAPSALEAKSRQLVDFDGDGRLALVDYQSSVGGFSERTVNGDWEPFTRFHALPRLDPTNPNQRFIDIDGDGIPDVVITEDDHILYYRSLGKEGFEPSVRVRKPSDEDEGPTVVFADQTETIFLADLTGDGLADIVRVRSDEISYWPSLGYGEWGRKIYASGSIHDAIDDEPFDPRRVQFGDVDGSGTADLIYVGHNSVFIFLNTSGNGWSSPYVIRSLPSADASSQVSVIDVLGQGTACLVWSSPLPGNRRRPLRYVDLLRGQKPHLLKSFKNNLGAETHVTYSPSTKFYLADKDRGRPWLTRLPFPVHLVSRVERTDGVSKSKLVTEYAYHHGHYDGRDRELRGFACVEQWDEESFEGDPAAGNRGPLPYDRDPAPDLLRLPRVRTVTWFHTGAWFEASRLERQLAAEYYRGDSDAPSLPDTILPQLDSTEERHNSARALRGQVLRKEVFAEDGSPEAVHPYVVYEQSYAVRRLQEARRRSPGVFDVHPREVITLHYERSPADPRILHQVILQVDAFGNIERSADLAYPRRASGYDEQLRLWCTATTNRYANRPGELDWYRVGVPYETSVDEIRGLPAPPASVFTYEQVREHVASAPSAATGTELRPVRSEQQHFYRDYQNAAEYLADAQGPLPLGHITATAQPHASYRLTFTDTFKAATYGGALSDAELRTAEYERRSGAWWAPSGRAVPDPSRFYLPVASIDQFGNRTEISYDPHAVLPIGTKDALGNVTTVGSRNAAGAVVENGNDYRVLAPALICDANRDRQKVEFNVRGQVSKLWRMGTLELPAGDDDANEGVFYWYDVLAWQDGRGPVYAHTAARLKHREGGAPRANDGSPRRSGFRHTRLYIDGFGREAMQKVQAEPGDVPVFDQAGRLRLDADGMPETRREVERWIGTGRTVFDTKGNPVKIYEPFASESLDYEDEKSLVEWGVTPVFRYDPLSRLVRVDQPNETFSKVDFSAWHQARWDENDTVLESEWFAKAMAGAPSSRRCAQLTKRHAGTPTIEQLDSLGRVFATVADNAADGKRETQRELDVNGDVLSVTAGAERGLAGGRRVRVLAQRLDLLRRPVDIDSADAGRRRTFPDVAGKPLRFWHPEGHELTMAYDALQRRTLIRLHRNGQTKVVERALYGETHPEAVERKLRGRIYREYDGAGSFTRDSYDFKGNAVSSSRRLAVDYRSGPDWQPLGAADASVAAIEAAQGQAQPPLLEAAVLTSRTTYDALDRVVDTTTPDGTLTRREYNERSLLSGIEVTTPGAAVRPVITAVSYNSRGQRTRLERASGVATEWTYDRETFRLRTVVTGKANGPRLQDLSYVHDPVGNVVQVTDGVSYSNASVPADGLYEYDALYQLSSAEGREHPGQIPTNSDAELLRLDHPNDMQKIRRYVERYTYDECGNISRLKHSPLGVVGIGGVQGWTRDYSYAGDSNRLLSTDADGVSEGLSPPYEYDDAGNLTRMPGLPELTWDHADRLVAASKQVVNSGTPERTYFAYDGSGRRVRKVTERQAAAGQVPTKKTERIYAARFERYVEYAGDGSTVDLARDTIHIADEQDDIALVEIKSRSGGNVLGQPEVLFRFQLRDHLGSASMELDEQGTPFSYEEYLPFGHVSLRASDSTHPASPRRFRHTGKERDETGLYYHGSRYYAPWLGRWISPDPAGVEGGTNLYRYVRNNPTRFHDPTGEQETEKQESKGVLGHVKDFGVGVWLGGKEMVVGTAQMAWNGAKLMSPLAWMIAPEDNQQSLDTLKTVGSTVWNEPAVVWDAVKKPYVEAWEQGRPGEAIGRGTFEVVSAVVGTKGLDKLSKTSKLGGALSKVDDLANVAEDVVQVAQDVSRVGDDVVRVSDELATVADDIALRAQGQAVPAAGAALVGPGDKLAAAAAWIKPQKGVFDVVVHGSEDAFHVLHNGKWVQIDQRALATFMRASGYEGGPVRLLSCSTGKESGSVAQHLANKLGAQVTAPTDTLWIHPTGSLTIGPTPLANSGKWVTFAPGVMK